MASGRKFLTVFVALMALSLMATPAFAQETPTPTPDTSTADVTPTPTPDTSTVDVTPTPTPESSSPTDDEGDGEGSGPKPVTQGQLTRNGLFGNVVAVGSSSIVVSTKWGNVTVNVNGGTRIKSKGQSITLADINVGDRAAIQLNGSPRGESDPDLPEVTPTPTPPPASPTPDATPTPTPDGATVTADLIIEPAEQNVLFGQLSGSVLPQTASPTPDATPTPEPETTPEPTPTPEPMPEPDPSFRDVTAVSIHIIPGKATRSHERGVVTGKCNAPEHARGKMKILDENGEETELDCSGGEGGEEGTDGIFIVRGQGNNKEVRGFADPDEITERLQSLGSLAKDERKALLDELKAEREAAREERLSNTENNAPAHAKGKAQKARGKRGGDDGGDGEGGDGGDGGVTPQRGNSGGGNENGNRGGGNDGNRGGGSNNGGGNGNRGGGNPNR